MRHHLAVLAIVLAALVAGAAPAAQAAKTRACGSVPDVYPGTRYAGDLSHITATGVSCLTAKRVARGAHRRALGLTPPPSGVRVFSWDGWRVTGDLHGSSDHYVATKGAKRVRWRF